MDVFATVQKLKVERFASATMYVIHVVFGLKEGKSGSRMRRMESSY